MAERTKDVSEGSNVIISEVIDKASVSMLSPENAVLIEKTIAIINPTVFCKSFKNLYLPGSFNPTFIFDYKEENGRAC